MINSLPQEWIERIFLRLHGRFGNNFTDKFKMGKVDNAGNDLGLINAKQVWAEELSGISGDRIKIALNAHYDFAPSCDQFKSQCKSPTTAHKDFVGIGKKFTQQEKDENHRKLQEVLAKLNLKRIA
jgi:hypothetical protein